MNVQYLKRYFLYNAVDIMDYQIFPAREIHNTEPAFNFASGDDDTFRELPSLERNGQPMFETVEQFMKRTDTSALLVIQKDKLLVERYRAGCDRSSVCTAFSVSKSFVSALVGIALHEKLITSLDDSLTRYLPELKEKFWGDIAIRHLLGMCSGLKYDARGFLPWNDEPLVYYFPNLRQLARRAKFSEPAGECFRYNNYNLLLLGMILERVTGGTVSKYLQEKIWQPLGMEFPASWSMDSENGMEKMESGLNASPIDFAKFGRLYLRRGDWNGKQIIPESWVMVSTTIEADAKWKNYKYLWWIPRSGNGRFMAGGNLGQFIYVAPDKECAVIRFGRGKPRNWAQYYPTFFASLMNTL